MTTWREVLAALKDDALDAPEREAIVARAAARLVTDRGTAGHGPGIEEVLTTAREEFGIVIDAQQAQAALNTLRQADG